MTRIGLPPKQLHFGTSGTMLVQICHCRVDHGMLLACARHVPPSAKPAEIGVQPRCPIFGIVEESEIFAPGQLVDLGNCIDCPKPCLAPGRRVELMEQARDMIAWMHRQRNAREDRKSTRLNSVTNAHLVCRT